MSDYTPPTLVIPTPGGNPGDGTVAGTLTVYEKADVAPNQNYVVAGANTYVLIGSDSSGNIAIGTGWPGNISLKRAVEIGLGVALTGSSTISTYKGINTVGMGVAPIYGDDARTGLTAADSAAKTLYTTTGAGQLYRLMGRILATAGTSPSATYAIKWTEGGATITKTLTISALDSDSDLSILIQPDNGTAITAQLTAISGTGTTVNVAATVEQMA